MTLLIAQNSALYLWDDALDIWVAIGKFEEIASGVLDLEKAPWVVTEKGKSILKLASVSEHHSTFTNFSHP